MKKIIVVAGLFISFLPAAYASASYKPDANAPRSAVPSIYYWDTSALFRSDAEFEAGYKNVESGLETLTAFKGKLDDPSTIKACLDYYVTIHKIFDKVSLYANLKNVEDDGVERYQKMRQRQISLANTLNAKALFIRDEILRLDDKTAAAIIDDSVLKDYKPYLDDLRRRKNHILSPDAEKVLSILGDNLWAEVDLNELPSDIEMVFKAVMRDIELPKIKDEDGKEIQLNLSNYAKYRSSKDRRVRTDTVESFFATLKKHQNIFAAILGGEMKRDVNLAKARDYAGAASAYLDREDISPKVIDNLINTVNKNLKPLRRYVELRKKLFKLPDVHIYDLYTPLVPSVSVDVPYDDAAKDILEALRPLGDEYVKVLSDAIQPKSGWVDIYPNKGKESGAFATSIWGLHPFVKMNYMNQIDDASTLAHEFGHAMHNYLNTNAQPYVTSGYSTLTAETASTLNEMLLSRYLTQKYKDDDKMRLYLLGERLELIRATVYRQTLFAEFEKNIHLYAEKGEPLTAELFNKTYGDLVKKYYGPGLIFDKDDDIEWAYIPHFYWKFYVYSYAAGLSSGIKMSENILNGAEGRDRYLDMLKAPANEKPLEVIAKAGVDLTKPASIEASTQLMNQTIDEIEEIINKGGNYE